MAILVLADHAEVTVDDLHTALSQRLSNKYDVQVFHSSMLDEVRISRAAWMAINVVPIRRKNQTMLKIGYTPSGFLFFLLVFLVVTWPVMIVLSRLRARRELEAEVIEAIRDAWPEVTG